MEQSALLGMGERRMHLGLEEHQNEPQQCLDKCRFLQKVYTGHHAKECGVFSFAYFSTQMAFLYQIFT